jgi:hypothetical protein
MIYGLWWGGYSYSHSEMEDCEVFDSVEDAQHVLKDRYDSNGQRHCKVRRADGRVEETLFPAVGQESEIHLYLSDPRESSDPYPDKRAYLDLVVRVENC